MKKLLVVLVVLLALIGAACGGAVVASGGKPIKTHTYLLQRYVVTDGSQGNPVQVADVPDVGLCVFSNGGGVWCTGPRDAYGN